MKREEMIDAVARTVGDAEIENGGWDGWGTPPSIPASEASRVSHAILAIVEPAIRADERAKVRAEVAPALKAAKSTFDMLTDQSAIGRSSAHQAWAMCVETEVSVRRAIAALGEET